MDARVMSFTIPENVPLIKCPSVQTAIICLFFILNFKSANFIVYFKVKMNCLHTSLMHYLQNKCEVHRFVPTKATRYYCEFSGSGNIHIYNADLSTPLVFVSRTAGNTESTEPDEGSSGEVCVCVSVYTFVCHWF